MRNIRLLLCIPLLCLLGCDDGEPQAASDPAVEWTTLPQNWSEEVRQRFWHTPQGSRLLPYEWFLALEQESSEELFRSDRSLSRFRFIPSPAGPHNPDALPIGFSREAGDEAHEAYVGLTCAACHTGLIDFEGEALLIDGGPAMIDFNAFLTALAEAMQATVGDTAKLERFAAALEEDEPEELLKALGRATDALAERINLNEPDRPAGYGRVDAFGNIFNQVAAVFLDEPENAVPPNAPVSYPALWDTPQHDRVQWNGSAINAGAGPLLRNAGEVMGVFGTLHLEPLPAGGGYASSLDTPNLVRLEKWIRELQSPHWPETLAPLDSKKVAAGEELFHARCSRCHLPIDPADPDRQVTATMVPVSELGVDPTMAQQFTRSAKSGALEGQKAAFAAGPPLPADAPAGALVVHAVVGGLTARPTANFPELLQQYFAARAQQAQEPLSYKARPLNGVWATAPYLHNGSVPTLRAMLAPPAERPATFRLGSRRFDPQNVGFQEAEMEESFVFDASVPGNSNAGHRYGTDLEPGAKEQLLEYLKSL